MTHTQTRQLTLWGGQPAKYIIILIAGKCGVGKTTLAMYLKDYLQKLNYMVSVVPFAQEIKRCATDYFGWDGKKDERGRRLLQRLGTDVGREYDPDIWVKAFLNNISRGRLHPDFVIADDWRFENEYDFITNCEEYDIIKIKVVSDYRGISNGHVSEHSLPEDESYYDGIVYNNDTLADLERAGIALVDKLLRGD